MNVKGSVVVKANHTWTPNVEYEVLFLDDQLIFIRTGGQSWMLLVYVVIVSVVVSASTQLARLGGVTGGSLLAAMFGSGVVVGLVTIVCFRKKQKNPGRDISAVGDMSVEEVLRINKRSFLIPNHEISKIQVKPSSFGRYGSSRGWLLIEARKRLRFDVVDPQPIENLEKLVASIPH